MPAGRAASAGTKTSGPGARSLSEACGLQGGTVIGAIGEEMRAAGPAMADGIEVQLRAGEAGGCEIDPGQAAVGVDDGMALAFGGFLGGVVADTRRRRLHRPAIRDAGAAPRPWSGPLAVHHQHDVVNGAEQHHPHIAPEPQGPRPPGRKVRRQRPPAATRARQITDRVHDLAHLNASLASVLQRRRQQQCGPRPISCR